MRTVDLDNEEARRAPSPEILAIPERVALALAALKRNGITAHQVARACGIPDSRFSKFKHGHHVGGIQADMVLRLARALQVDPGWLLSGEGDMVARRALATGAASPTVSASASPGSPTVIVIQASPGLTPETILKAVTQLPGATEWGPADEQRSAANPLPASQQGSRKRRT